MTVGEFFNRLLQTLFAVVSLLWLSTIIYAQAHCNLLGAACYGGDHLVWLVPILTAPFGILGLTGLLLMYRQFRGGEDGAK